VQEGVREIFGEFGEFSWSQCKDIALLLYQNLLGNKKKKKKKKKWEK